MLDAGLNESVSAREPREMKGRMRHVGYRTQGVLSAKFAPVTPATKAAFRSSSRGFERPWGREFIPGGIFLWSARATLEPLAPGRERG